MREENTAPINIQKVIWNSSLIHILNSALELGIFDVIHRSAYDLKEIAEKIKASQKGTRVLLDALVVMDFIRKKGDKYYLTPESELFLVSDKPTCLADFVMLHNEGIYSLWSHLSEAIRSGIGKRNNEHEEKKGFYSRLVRGLFTLNYPLSWRLVEVLGIDKIAQYLRILDVAAGSAPWSIAMAEANPDSHVTAVDSPEVLEVTKEYVKRHGLEGQFMYISGDVNELSFDEGNYDLAILGNICHSQGTEYTQKLFSKVYSCLRTEGEIITIDTIPDEEKNSPFFPVLFAVLMFLNTPDGDTFTFSQFKQYLLGAGFTNIRRLDLSLETSAVVGEKIDHMK
jgi:2-polyprenyl-3-methyl-5-hydroxy-6-metoxy-1,4-benzoquinol methylase